MHANGMMTGIFFCKIKKKNTENIIVYRNDYRLGKLILIKMPQRSGCEIIIYYEINAL